jgi:hypothetical protein
MQSIYPSIVPRALRPIAVAVLLIAIHIVPAVAEQVGTTPYISQEISEKDGVPVLIKHLPDWESVRNSTTFATDTSGLKAALGERRILDLIDFTTGTEAVMAQYDVGKLLIVEYTSPQVSVDADSKFTAALEADPEAGSTAYRRIGNYNVFVFDTADQNAAAALLDQVKYEKNIQWLGDNPFRISAERAFVITTSDIFLSTLLVILMGIGLSIVSGLIVGFVYFQLGERRRANMPTFTDAGGMTRLNLDGFTPEIVPKRLLGEKL